MHLYFGKTNPFKLMSASVVLWKESYCAYVVYF
jgi:hypothetical protein